MIKLLTTQKTSEIFLHIYQVQQEQYIDSLSDEKTIKTSIIITGIMGLIITLICIIF